MKKFPLASLGLCALMVSPAFATAPSVAVPPSSAEVGATTSDQPAASPAVSSQRKRRAGKSPSVTRRQEVLSPDTDLDRGTARGMRGSSGAGDTEDRGTTQGADAAGDWRRRTGEPLDDRSGPMNTPQPSDPVSDNIRR